jgi:PhnB protein
MEAHSVTHEDNATNEQHPPMGVTPILTVADAASALAFYTKAFNARAIASVPAPDGKRLLHVRVMIEGSTVVFMDSFPELDPHQRPHLPTASGTPVTLHLQVQDAQAVWDRAIAAGAVAVVPLQEMFWGELYGRVQDPFDHEWTIAQMLRPMTPEAVAAAARLP